MNVELITIGDEILIGQVVDTNSAWMATELNAIGHNVVHITSVGDEGEAIKAALEQAMKRADVIITTGGLGPTRDDITKSVFCDFFGCGLVFHPPTFENIQRIFALRNYPLTDVNKAQAQVPAACTPLLNRQGTAPGMWFEKDGRYLVSLPGVPFEMKGLMTGEVLPRLASFTNGAIVHRTVLTHGMGESMLAERIRNWEDNLPAGLKLAYLPQPGKVRLRLSGTGDSRKELQAAVDERINELYTLIPELIFGEGDYTLEQAVSELLRKNGLTLATAESCTGGNVARLITSLPGSSDIFTGSIVAYANEAKETLLNVSRTTLETHGAVSRETALEMALGVRSALHTSTAISVTGIAGPTGGTPEKPVGTTWICTMVHNDVRVQLYTFGDNRERNIERASAAALGMLYRHLTELLPNEKNELP